MKLPEYRTAAELACLADVPGGFLARTLPRDDCCIMIELMLSLPEVYTLAVGSRSCMQFMYPAMYGRPQAKKLLYVPQELRECVDSGHLETVEKAVEMALAAGAKAVLLYLCCADVLIGTDFTGLCARLEDKHSVPIRALPRGFVATRRKSTTACLLDIVDGLFSRAVDNPYKENKDANASCSSLGGTTSPFDGANAPEHPLCTPNVKEIENHHFLHIEKQVALLSARPVPHDSTLCALLREAGFCIVTNHCATLSEFVAIPRSHMALALDNFGVEFAKRLSGRFGLKFLAIPNRFDEDGIDADLRLLCDTLRLPFDPDAKRREMRSARYAALCRAEGKAIAVGIQGQAVPLAASLLSTGFYIPAIFCDELNQRDLTLLQAIASTHPDTRVYFTSILNANHCPDILENIQIAIGSKAGFFCRNARTVLYDDRFAFAYEKFSGILEAID